MMKLAILATVLVVAAPSAVFATPVDVDGFQHTHFLIVNNTGAPVYFDFSDSSPEGTWQTPLPVKMTGVTYRNTLNSFLSDCRPPLEEGQVNFITCPNPTIHDGQAYCGTQDFCNVYTNLMSKYTPHYYANVNAQAGTYQCSVEKTVTRDGMDVVYTINKK